MRPLFTIHAGEYVVGDFLERTFSNINVNHKSAICVIY